MNEKNISKQLYENGVKYIDDITPSPVFITTYIANHNNKPQTHTISVDKFKLTTDNYIEVINDHIMDHYIFIYDINIQDYNVLLRAKFIPIKELFIPKYINKRKAYIRDIILKDIIDNKDVIEIPAWIK